MTHLAAIITDLALILIVAGFTTLLCKKFNQPAVIGYILAGFLIGPVVAFIPTVADTANITIWADIGVIFLMFGLGLEFSLHKMAEIGTTGIITATVQVAGMMLMGFFVGQMIGWSTMNSVFLGGMLSMSSTMIVMKALDDTGMKEQRFTNIAMGTLIFEDIAAIFLMVILSTIAVSSGISGMDLGFHLVKLFFYLAVWIIFGIYLIPTFLKKSETLLNGETLLVLSLGICFGMVWLANALGMSSALGAFLAGSILASTTNAESIEKLIKPCKDLFGAVFFVSVGLLVVPSMLLEYFVPIIILVLVTIIGKIILLTLGMLAAGEDLSTSLHAALAQVQIGEFSFIIATLGISLGVTSDFLYPIIVAVAVITTFITPFCIRSADPICSWLERNLPEKWMNALNHYSQGRKASTTNKDEDWQHFLKGYCTTFAIYVVIILGIIQVSISVLLPWVGQQFDMEFLLYEKIAICILIYILITPFLRTLLIFRKRYFTSLWLKNESNHFPLTVLMILRSAATVFLMMLPLILLFDWPMPLFVIAAIPAIYFLAHSDWLASRYLKIEAQFLSNFNDRILQEKIDSGEIAAHNWLVEQLFVEEYVCHHAGNIKGLALKELDWAKKLNTKVIKIVRGKHHLNIPEGYEKFYYSDRVFVLGSEKSLENFTMVMERENLMRRSDRAMQTLHEFIESQMEPNEDNHLLCYAIRVGKDSPISGKTIKDSMIKTNWNCFLVGLERGIYPIINTDPNLVIESDDLLWVLGPQKMGRKLFKQGLI